MQQLSFLSRILSDGTERGTCVIVSWLLVNMLTCGDNWSLNVLFNIVSFALIRYSVILVSNTGRSAHLFPLCHVRHVNFRSGLIIYYLFTIYNTLGPLSMLCRHDNLLRWYNHLFIINRCNLIHKLNKTCQKKCRKRTRVD